MSTETTTTTTQTDDPVTIVPNSEAGSVLVNTAPKETDDTPDQDLIGGKFKTNEDLLAAYQELEKKQSTATGDGDTGDAGDTTDDGDTGDSGDTGDAEPSAYGPVVTNALAAAEIDIADVQKAYAENGTLSDEQYEKLGSVGFPKAMVEAYMRGMTATEAEIAKQTEISQAQVDELKALAGGDQGLKDIQNHIKTSWSAEDVAAFNADVSTADIGKARAAIEKARASYVEKVGTEGSLIGGRNAPSATGFETEAAMLEAMASPKYKTSQAYRDEVSAKLAASPHLLQLR